jgi:hypothetical protein
MYARKDEWKMMSKGAKNYLKWYYYVGKSVLVILGVVTLVPAPSSQKNMIGYYSLDPFAPISAIALWVIAGAIYWFGKKREEKT